MAGIASILLIAILSSTVINRALIAVQLTDEVYSGVEKKNETEITRSNEKKKGMSEGKRGIGREETGPID
jgi:hypothetical protein